ncbi:MAG: hypothetical protein V4529_03065 [Gemmatimonadota bacterium]
MRFKLGHALGWRHAESGAMFHRPGRIGEVGTKMKTTIAGLAGLIMAVTPLALPAQGLRVSSVIPTQSLTQHSAAFAQLTPRAPAVVAVEPAPAASCNMPVVAPAPDATGMDAGGVAPPANRAVPTPTARAACVNRLAGSAPDRDLLKKP